MNMQKLQLIKELEREIKDSLFDMDSLLDLMGMEEYKDEMEVLQTAWDKLYEQTEEYKREYYKLCKELDIIEDMFSIKTGV